MQQQGQRTIKNWVKFTKSSYMFLEGKHLPFKPSVRWVQHLSPEQQLHLLEILGPSSCPSLSSCACCPNPSWPVCSLRVMGVMNQSCRIIIKLLLLLGVDMEADGLQRPEVRTSAPEVSTSAPDGPAGAAHLLLERGLHVHRPHWLGRFLFQA